ncbi:efflux RND transporter periplasmic adaptor subunit [Azospirillum rugosum]|uniref:RND family efflux transporter MFP subunit n=1 Tax=Azospirillum rugosum TaxID=416170 RepID=A0ABS4SP57_9PROT|nr:efflux RND transporter periplasmic adaptor subunit [Azospirillum rugosum]MBP2293722.1 RND family efflux transporter MFP subunit [Azospirillum rugosum]MDQ0527267.1 RND family efflux transporter MFP subunit [Azospirillum rugosum]
MTKPDEAEPRPTTPDPAPESKDGARADQTLSNPAAPGLPVPVAERPLVPRPPVPAVPRPSLWRRLRVPLVVVLLAAALGAAALWWAGRAPLVGVTGVERGPAIEAVYATGTVESLNTVRVGPPVGGRVATVLVDDGDRVTAGQRMATLDPRQLEQRLQNAEVRLRLARTEATRVETLLARGVTTVEARDKAVAERQQAEADVALARRMLDDLIVNAPIDGVVLRRQVEAGESVAANAVLFTVADPTRLRVVADVDERDIPRVHIGSRIAARAEAFPGDVFQAAVTNIRAESDSQTRTYRIEATLPPGSPLYIGMTLDVNVIVAERRDALLVPAGAVQREPPRGGRPGQAHVWTVGPDGRVKRVPVTLGAEGPARVEVTEGIGPDDRLLEAPPASLAEGDRVRVRP